VDRAKQALRLETDRATPLREAVLAVRKAGTVVVLGVYGLTDSFPTGVVLNKGLTIRSAQQHGQRYVPRLLEHLLAGDLQTSFLATHPMSLEDGVRGYEMFKDKTDGCVRAVFAPGGVATPA
jgi:threonine dehydrogenase-like Zn-dependent dehydrogenase